MGVLNYQVFFLKVDYICNLITIGWNLVPLITLGFIMKILLSDSVKLISL